MNEEMQYFEIRGYLPGSTINAALDKLLDMCSNHDLIRYHLEVMDPLTGHIVATSVENGSEQK